MEHNGTNRLSACTTPACREAARFCFAYGFLSIIVIEYDVQSTFAFRLEKLGYRTIIFSPLHWCAKLGFLYGTATIAEDFTPHQCIDPGKNALFNGNCYFGLAHDSHPPRYDKYSCSRTFTAPMRQAPNW
jgi:hypothetical protein